MGRLFIQKKISVWGGISGKPELDVRDAVAQGGGGRGNGEDKVGEGEESGVRWRRLWREAEGVVEVEEKELADDES